MKIALLQYQAGQDKDQNIQKALSLCRQAIRRKAQLILLPENFHWQASALDRKKIFKAAEKIPGPSTQPFLDLAAKHGVFILLGSLVEQHPNKKKPYNTSVLINDQGRVQAIYRKIHLFKAQVEGKNINEATHYSRGGGMCVAQAKGIRIGLSICYDLRFPQIFAQYRAKGVHLVCVPSCFTKKTGEAHWEALLRARAIENLFYVAAPNQIGQTQGRPALYGNSMVIDPWGKVIVRGSTKKQEIVYARINPNKIKEAKKALPDF